MNTCGINGHIVHLVNKPDAEWLAIMRKLATYGIQSCGSKSGDRAKLHEIELEIAKQENCVTDKFLTVKKAEQEKIQDKKKEKEEISNINNKQDFFDSAKILGEQKLLAIEINNKNIN